MNNKQIKAKTFILGIHFVVLDWTVIKVNWGLASMLDGQKYNKLIANSDNCLYMVEDDSYPQNKKRR